jgi:hypothetical protein
LTVLIESTTKLAKKFGSTLIILLDIEVLAQFSNASSPRVYTETARFYSIYLQASLAAILYPEMILVGCTLILIS